MTVLFATFEERPDLAARYEEEGEAVWPADMEFIHHDPVCEEYWPRLGAELPGFQLVAHDGASGRFLAVGNTVPLSWSGADDDLPLGVPDALRRAFAERAKGVGPTAVCALLAGIQPAARSQGLSAGVLTHMKAIARRHALSWLIAPVRPSLKARYPLTPMERYMQWRRPDGRMFDPWLRTHERLGARLARIGPNGNVFRGTVADWERWTGLVLPESGRYIVAGALEPLRVDRERDEAILIEPNVWMVHPVDTSGGQVDPDR